MPELKQEEWDNLIRQVESKTCFRYTAGTTSDTAFMVPVGADDIVMGSVVEFNLEQLRAMAALPEQPK